MNKNLQLLAIAIVTLAGTTQVNAVLKNSMYPDPKNTYNDFTNNTHDTLPNYEQVMEQTGPIDKAPITSSPKTSKKIIWAKSAAYPIIGALTGAALGFCTNRTQIPTLTLTGAGVGTLFGALSMPKNESNDLFWTRVAGDIAGMAIVTGVLTGVSSKNTRKGILNTISGLINSAILLIA